MLSVAFEQTYVPHVGTYSDVGTGTYRTKLALEGQGGLTNARSRDPGVSQHLPLWDKVLLALVPPGSELVLKKTVSQWNNLNHICVQENKGQTPYKQAAGRMHSRNTKNKVENTLATHVLCGAMNSSIFGAGHVRPDTVTRFSHRERLVTCHRPRSSRVGISATICCAGSSVRFDGWLVVLPPAACCLSPSPRRLTLGFFPTVNR